jgi:hypothetical protein
MTAKEIIFDRIFGDRSQGEVLGILGIDTKSFTGSTVHRKTLCYNADWNVARHQSHDRRPRLKPGAEQARTIRQICRWESLKAVRASYSSSTEAVW